MHILVTHILAEEQGDVKYLRQTIVLSNTEILRQALGISEKGIEELYKHGKSIRCGRYNIVVQNRCFHKWIKTIEIEPCKGSIPWICEGDDGGTATINIAPVDVINEVLTYLKHYK